MPRSLVLAALLVLGGCTIEERPASAAPPLAEPGSAATLVLDQAMAERLLNATGVTLQWISWDRRGPISVWEENGVIRLRGSQEGRGRLDLEGEVREIGRDYFVFDGRITIRDTPDPGRFCEADKLWHFAITQNRPYWRLREFEWCDELTDYVDIYF